MNKKGLLHKLLGITLLTVIVLSCTPQKPAERTPPQAGGPEEAAPAPEAQSAVRPQWASVYIVTENLRLRSGPDAGRDNVILTLPQGSRVELIQLGPTETIEGINAPWFAVHVQGAEDAATGWVFSGYLTPQDEPAVTGTLDYSKLLNGDFSDFTKGTWGERGERLRADGTFEDGTGATVPRRNSDGSYSWGIYYYEGSGYGVILWPVGLEINVNGIVPSDTTKVRMARGQEFNPDQIIYYQE